MLHKRIMAFGGRIDLRGLPLQWPSLSAQTWISTLQLGTADKILDSQRDRGNPFCDSSLHWTMAPNREPAQASSKFMSQRKEDIGKGDIMAKSPCETW